MREIKFRAWRPENKEMDYGFLGRCDLDNCLNSRGVFKDWKIMQYTGLEDKNGRMIFEGDIFKEPKNNSLGLRKVVFEDCSFHAPLLKEDNHVGFNKILLSHSFLEIEIIGNIYENTELIKN